MGRVNDELYHAPREFYEWHDPEPEQDHEEPVGFVPALITGLAQLASIALFMSMIAMWAAIGDRNFPGFLQ